VGTESYQQHGTFADKPSGQKAALVMTAAPQLAVGIAWKEFSPLFGKTTPLRAHLAGRITPFVSIKYLLWDSYRSSKA
jgi:hypothetical protein